MVTVELFGNPRARPGTLARLLFDLASLIKHDLRLIDVLSEAMAVEPTAAITSRAFGHAKHRLRSEKIVGWTAEHRILGSSQAYEQTARELCWALMSKVDGRIVEGRAGKEPIPTDLRWFVWSRDDFTCQHRGSRDRRSIDHIIPESKGGNLDPANLQTLCSRCNSKKARRGP